MRASAAIFWIRNADALAITQRTAEYILDLEGEGQRVGAVRFSNCEAGSPADAIKEIMATQALNVRAKGDRTYHLVVSFAAGERPPQDQIVDIESTLCDTIGLGQHQRLSAVHIDTEHLHIHIAINKIHPKTFRMIEPFYDQRRLMAACEALEQKHGLQRTNHGRTHAKTAADRDGVSDEETRLQFRQRVREVFARDIEVPLVEADGWPALHRIFAKHGLAVRPRGAGLVIASANGHLTVKASSIDGSLSMKALTSCFGPFVAGAAGLSQASANKYSDPALAAIKASYKKRGDAIKASRTLTASGKRAAFRDLGKLRRAAYDRLKSERGVRGFSAQDDATGGAMNGIEAYPAGSQKYSTATPSAALQCYTAARNSLRTKISDINNHAIWTPKDAGPASYYGRRRLADGSWALLLLKGGTVLVKAVSAAKADGAKLWPLGKTIALDAGGRIVKRKQLRR